MQLTFFSTSACSRRASNTAGEYQHNVKIWKTIRTLEVEIFEIVMRSWIVKNLRKVRLLLGGKMRVERREGRRAVGKARAIA